MNMRRITSLTALISFILLMLTSVVLYIVPAGRVAYWSGYQLWGMSKVEWGNVHINLGVLFLISILLHIYYNWAPIVTYMKNKSKQVRIFTPEFNVSLLLTVIVFWGSLAGIPPMSSLLHLGEAISEEANLKYGEPPYGHAELSPLVDFSKKVDVELETALELLQKAGIRLENPQLTMQDIADANGLSPQDIYLMIKPQVEKSATEVMPEEPLGGTGKRTLAQICEMYSLSPAKIIQGLAAKNINAQLDQQMKGIAAANGIDPHSLYAEIYQLQK